MGMPKSGDEAKIGPFSEVPPLPNKLMLETNLSARFITKHLPTPVEQVQLDVMNKRVDLITERLQAAFRLLIVEMMDLEHELTKEK